MVRVYTFLSTLTAWNTSLRWESKLSSSYWKFFLILLGTVGFLLFKEFLPYWIWYLFWPSTTCGNIRELHSVLLVAGPRILGESSQSWFIRWSDDRYLRKSFATALHHVKPDLIVFLGDLMEEGSLATDEEYERYLRRFREIFQLDNIPSSKILFIPGDRDIGRDLATLNLTRSRFKVYFQSPTVLSLSNIQIIQIDKLQQLLSLSSSGKSNWTRIVISQSPLLGAPDAFTEKVLQKLRPHAMLSAQDHSDMLPEDNVLVQFNGDVTTGKRLSVETVDTSCTNFWDYECKPTWRFQWSERQVVEVVVPTCSGRSRASTDLGYGVATIDERREAWCYHILWLQPQLYFVATYLCAVAVMSAVVAVVIFCQRRYCHSRLKSLPQYKPL
uniref:Calcineurin-like phosphoesterase domain-containing protein n=1 Tax=Graphocephala atropunctata TaxID=36148 RepID=A0A1B6KXB9_9HEMI